MVERARVVLEALETGERENGGKAETLFEDLPLFSVAAPQASPPKGPSPVEEALAAVHPDELSPMQALQLVYDLKAKLK